MADDRTLNDIVAEADWPIHVTLSNEMSVDFSSSNADVQMVATLRLEQDGATPRSKRIPLCPPIIVASHAVGLRMLADLFEVVEKDG